MFWDVVFFSLLILCASALTCAVGLAKNRCHLHITHKTFVLDAITGKIYSLFVIKLFPLHNKSENNGAPEEIWAWFGSIFSPDTNISLNISIQFPHACEMHLLWSDRFTLSKQQNGNNDINDPANEWRSHCCISIMLLKRKLGDFKVNLASPVAVSQMRMVAKAPLGALCEILG